MTLPRLAALTLLVAGAASLCLGLAGGWALFREPEPQIFVGPGETRLEVQRGAPRTLWVHVRAVPGPFGRYPAAPVVVAQARSLSGESVAFVPASHLMFVSQRQSRRYAVGDFQFSTPGGYRITIEQPAEKFDFSLSDAGHGRLVAQFALGLILGLGSVIGGAVWLAFQRP